MASDDQWIGNLGHLALADAMLGASLIDILTILAPARYPDPPETIDRGSTTRQSALAVQKILEGDRGLFGDAAGPWLAETVAATDARNALLHAVALNQCDVCGAASRFVHPRSGNEVDRSDEAVQELTAQLWSLREDGKAVAMSVSGASLANWEVPKAGSMYLRFRPT